MSNQVIYAVRTVRKPTPERARQGCPATGWIHEAARPWRVIASPIAAALTVLPGEVDVFPGGEDTVDFDEWVARR